MNSTNLKEAIDSWTAVAIGLKDEVEGYMGLQSGQSECYPLAAEKSRELALVCQFLATLRQVEHFEKRAIVLGTSPKTADTPLPSAAPPACKGPTADRPASP